MTRLIPENISGVMMGGKWLISANLPTKMLSEAINKTIMIYLVSEVRERNVQRPFK